MTRRTEPAVDRLLTRKADLERLISDELRRPAPDWLHLKSLKRARLALKDRVTGLLRGRSRQVAQAQ